MAAELNTDCCSSEGLACTLTSPELAARKEQIAQTLGAGATRVTASETHVILEFDRAGPWIGEIAAFVQFEQSCCPFLGYSIEIGANDGPMLFSIGGSTEAKQFLLSELGDALKLSAGRTT